MKRLAALLALALALLAAPAAQAQQIDSLALKPGISLPMDGRTLVPVLQIGGEQHLLTPVTISQLRATLREKVVKLEGVLKFLDTATDRIAEQPYDLFRTEGFGQMLQELRALENEIMTGQLEVRGCSGDIPEEILECRTIRADLKELQKGARALRGRLTELARSQTV